MKLQLTALTSLLLATSVQAKLDVQIYHADENSFSVTSTLITGEKKQF